jgi:hypothetical protein
MALAWKAGWVNALRGSNPLSSAISLPSPRLGPRVLPSLGMAATPTPQRTDVSGPDPQVVARMHCAPCRFRCAYSAGICSPRPMVSDSLDAEPESVGTAGGCAGLVVTSLGTGWGGTCDGVAGEVADGAGGVEGLAGLVGFFVGVSVEDGDLAESDAFGLGSFVSLGWVGAGPTGMVGTDTVGLPMSSNLPAIGPGLLPYNDATIRIL